MAHIIVMDDDPDMCLFIQSALRRVGHRVDVANNGLVGMAINRQDPADLIITDIIMPSMDGIEVIADLLRHKTNTPILAISGGGHMLGSHFVLKIANTFRVHHTLSKPFTVGDLLNKVAAILPVPLSDIANDAVFASQG